MRKSVLPSATIASGPGKVSEKQVEDFTSSEGKRNSEIEKKKRRSVDHQGCASCLKEERIRGRDTHYLKGKGETTKKYVEGKYQSGL